MGWGVETSQDFFWSWKVPSGNSWRMVWRRGKNPEARLYCRVLSNGIKWTIIESKIYRLKGLMTSSALNVPILQKQGETH